MKTKLILLLACLFVTKLGNAQDTKYVLTKRLGAYDYKSYVAVDSVVLVDGFTFSAFGSSNFFIRIEKLSMPVLAKEIASPSYIETQLIRAPGIKTLLSLDALSNDQKVTNRKYLDGFGRDLQTIYIGAGSSSKNDLVSFKEYDARGKISTNFLPYAANTQKQFQTTALADQAAFYSTGNTGGKYAKDNAPYAKTVYENSPAQRVLQESGYGTNWQLASGKVKQYVNRTNTSLDNVRLFKPDGTSSSFYAAGSLVVNEVTDEEGHKSIVFADQKGNTLLKRQVVDETIQGQYQEFKETYYIYNIFGAVCLVTPPKVTAELKSNGWNLTANNLGNNTFQFIYDGEGKLIKRKKPSADWAYIVYDKLDRPVLTQNGRQRAEHKWFFTKYDLANRPVMEGILLDNDRITYDDMKSAVDGFDYLNPAVPFHEDRGNGLEGYTNLTFPNTIGNSNLLAVYYYDFYDLDNNSTPEYNYLSQGLGTEEPQASSGNGNLTVSKSRILGTSNWLTKAFFYDDKGQMIQQQNNNAASLSAIDVTTIVYNFDGTVKKKIVKKNNGAEQKAIERYAYDAVGRLKELAHQVNANPEVVIASYSFNEIGQLVDKNLGKINGASWLQSVDYKYNIRGWLTHINNPTLTADGYNEESNDLFGMELLYEQSGDIGNTGLYNGQISGTKWRMKMANHDFNDLERAYAYSYDKLGQIRDAIFKAKQGAGWNYMVDAFSEKGIQYDLNGNITALRRFMWNNSTHAVLEMDHLTYGYDSQKIDQLVKVDDSEGYAGGYGFKDLASESQEYQFDEDGNLIRDKNKGIDISYNEVGKIKRISYIADPAKYIDFQYSSSGERLNKSVFQNSTLVKRVDYLDGFVYENSTLNSIAHAEGRVRISGGNIKYEYAIRDQLGNTRVSFEDNGNGQAEVRQESSYYVFGLQHAPVSKPNNPNNSLFNGGSEWLADFDNDPDFYSTANREYDAVLGRFNGLDPLAELFTSWSPYSFSFNNPVIYSDPSGAAPISDDTLAMLYAFAADTESGGTDGVSFYRNSNGGWSYEFFKIAPNSNVSWGDDGTGYLTTITWYHASDGKPITSDNVSAQAWVMEIPSLKNNGKRSSGSSNGSQEEMTHEQELAKYGQIKWAFGGTLSGALIGGITYEYGIVATDKGWLQYYQSIYYTHGLGLSIAGNVTKIVAKSGQSPTFSDWRGVAGGMSLGGSVSGNFSTSSAYNAVGAGYGTGLGFSWQNGKSASFSIGKTTLIGEPYRADQIGKPNYTNDYIRSLGQH